MSEITNDEDVLDSRNVQERIDELKQENKLSKDAGEDIKLREENLAELEQLLKLKAQYVDYWGESSWNFGATLIRDSYFEDYARELADDIGAIDENQSWPTMYIDWGRATEALLMDYTEVHFDGVTYWTQEA